MKLFVPVLLCFRSIRISFSARSERRATEVITSYAATLGVPSASILVRLGGLYGDAASLLDMFSAGLAVVTRSRADHLPNLDLVKHRLVHAPDQATTHPESGMTRALYDCVAVPLTPAGPEVRLAVTTHPATDAAPVVGVERDGIVYELFISTLPSPAFTASDVLELSLNRGSFETVLAGIKTRSKRGIVGIPIPRMARTLPRSSLNGFGTFDENGDNSSLHLTTEYVPAHEAEPSSTDESESPAAPPPAVMYVPPQWARSSFPHGFPGSTFTPQPDGSFNHPLYLQERRPERNGSSHRLLTQPLLPLLLLRGSGATGHVAASGEPGRTWSAAKRPAWTTPLHSLYHTALAPQRRSSPERSARIGVFPGTSEGQRNARPADAPQLIVTLSWAPSHLCHCLTSTTCQLFCSCLKIA